MKRHHGLSVVTALALAALLAGCWGSDKSTSLEVAVATQPARVGSSQCTNTCHAATQDILGQPIAATWSAALHTTGSNVQCEDCHGGGGNHWGVGPIPYPNPSGPSCNVCHGFTGFAATAHGNPDSLPPADFFQAPVGDGSGQAKDHGIPVVKADNTTPVTIGEHLEECSRCHNPNQKFEHGPGNVLVKPNPDALPTPSVTCGSCHNGHDTYKEATIVQRTSPVKYPNFRPYFVDDNPASSTFGAQVNSGAAGGALVTASIYQPNGAVTPGTGVLDYTRVVGGNNELNPERLCAACHTKGKYKFTKFNTNGQDVSDTHQTNVFTQYRESGHADRTAPAFGEFSANPGFYNAAFGNDHRTAYPIDMALSTFSAAGPANTTRNAGNNNFACFKCHNGLTSLAYQDNVEGTSAAPVVFGDVTVTCLTCHDPHTDVTGQTKNTRKPLVMSKYNAGGLVFSGNVFFDNTPVPSATGNATICVFCHQGRESGFTLFKRRLAADNTLAGSFLNEHYLGTGAMLWARNAYEYGGKLYGQNTAHQSANCIGCHMAENPAGRDDIGGHSWNIFSEADNVVNNASCNVSACHNGRVPGSRDGLFAFRDSVFDPTADYDGDGVVEGIPQEIEGLESILISLLDNNGITYNDTAYPYFFIKGSASAFTAWTLPTLKAAFNLQYVIKGLPSGASQIGQPNPSAATHNHRYNIQLLVDSYTDLYNNTASPNPALPPPGALVRPAGTRAATNYNPQAGGGYNPRQ
jgi:uncharacterized CHY-type Zn-finger protein